ncbi:MAG TPA: hypothetical protein VK855_01395 [Thioalkalivibrio sp.]|nr:hypothetical protein [Thioalkalivibrio sp.]
MGRHAGPGATWKRQGTPADTLLRLATLHCQIFTLSALLTALPRHLLFPLFPLALLRLPTRLLLASLLLLVLARLFLSALVLLLLTVLVSVLIAHYYSPLG